ncbi:rhoGAP domain-containing protein [Ditylenchus destructor]|nr:rhoGAP domain-containing protein [Ditylenchus destructor]
MDRNRKIASDDSIKVITQWKELQAHYLALAMSQDEEILQMIDLLEKTRQNWSAAVKDCKSLKSANASLKRENENLDSELHNTRDKHREAQAQIASLVTTNQSLANEIDQYKKRFVTVKSILKEDCAKYASIDKLKQLPFFNEPKQSQKPRGSPPSSRASIANTDDIDYDKTGDSFHEILVEESKATPKYGKANPRRSHRLKQSNDRKQPSKRSASQPRAAERSNINFSDAMIAEEDEDLYERENLRPAPPKRSKENGYEITATAVLKIDPQGVRPTKADVAVYRKASLNRSVSESNVFEEKPVTNPQSAGRSALAPRNGYDMRSPMSGFGNFWTHCRPIAECEHNFVPCREFFTGACGVCLKSWGMNLGMKSLKCQECKLYVHDRCKTNAPIPCIPFVSTPQRQRQARPRLADYCPNSRPQIPGIIIRCVVALEKGFLNKEGLYRIAGSESEVKVITSCIKKFLCELREALIPTSSYKEFIRAAESENREELTVLVNGLPIPHRDTLAFLCAHLQKVASNASINRMPLENLATVLGPTIVGPTKSVVARRGGALTTGTAADEAAEVHRQINTLIQLLKLDTEFWTNIITSPIGNVMGTPMSSNRTPLASSKRNPRPREFDADKSVLGPVTKSPPQGGFLIQPMSRRTPGKQFFELPY